MFMASDRKRSSDFHKRRLKMKARRILKNTTITSSPGAGDKHMRVRNRQHQSTATTKKRSQNLKSIPPVGPLNSQQQQVAGNNGRSKQASQINKINATECICSGCDKQIKDRFLLSACDKYWHESCLKCDRCQANLGELGPSLYNKSNMILCRQDYLEMFGQTAICSVCEKLIYASEMVMRAKQNIYHLECFACQLCGQRFYLFENKIVCQFDYEEHILPIQRSLLEGPRPLEPLAQLDTQSCLTSPTNEPTLGSNLVRIADSEQLEPKGFSHMNMEENTSAVKRTPAESPKLICLETPASRQTENTIIVNSNNNRCPGPQVIGDSATCVRQQQSERSLLLYSHEPGSRPKETSEDWRRQLERGESLIDVPAVADGIVKEEGNPNMINTSVAIEERKKDSSDCAQIEAL